MKFCDIKLKFCDNEDKIKRKKLEIYREKNKELGFWSQNYDEESLNLVI